MPSQILAYPINSNSTPFALLFDRGACTQLDSVMIVVGVLSYQSLMFVMPVISFFFIMPAIDVSHACC